MLAFPHMGTSTPRGMVGPMTKPFGAKSLQQAPKLLAVELSIFATDLPQAQTAHDGQWRISAGFHGWHFVAKSPENAPI
ncbi:hypothetical protein D9M71_618780 [compost metagenome]